MRMLVIADRYDRDSEPALADVVAEHRVDAVVTAGDLIGPMLTGISDVPVLTMGVYGNHCNGTYLDKLGIENLHLRRVMHHGISFTGLQGCVRYKAGSSDLLYTQDEYHALVAALPPADILVTHCPPRGINDHTDAAHVGIDALVGWMDRARPRMLIHGHTYPKAPITMCRGTRIEYVYGTRIVDI